MSKLQKLKNGKIARKKIKTYIYYWKFFKKTTF